MGNYVVNVLFFIRNNSKKIVIESTNLFIGEIMRGKIVNQNSKSTIIYLFLLGNDKYPRFYFFS